ncbi:peptidylprolyl isomerase [Colwellia sp. 12G3]|uniref:peptidylprolyl isomerase n=1 Tax=Colwellia sp. 12G3 TaxID=2058299 RepID=UPI000C324147|nr:peptidylprolyl isomerase [Colwellia sp. 12G3]PKI13851.1 peptidylprolyl isomerase [Colwellia sp. 12G3]
MFNQITKKNTRTLLSLIGIATASLTLANTANATIVEIKTSLSTESIKVNLFDTTTPETVKNFLNYLNEGHYTNSVIHRAVPDFIVQGGGFEFTGEWPLTALVSDAPVINEPVYSNVQGTIAMAKKGNNVHSATNQWFFNLKDNSDNLDRQNGGFTVFGQVISGMDIIENITLLTLCTSEGLEGIPMVMDNSQTCGDMSAPGMENFVVIEYVGIFDNTKVTDSDLIPLKSKEPDSDGDGVIDIADAFPSDANKYLKEAEESDGGSIAWFSIVMLALVSTRKRILKR